MYDRVRIWFNGIIKNNKQREGKNRWKVDVTSGSQWREWQKKAAFHGRRGEGNVEY